MAGDSCSQVDLQNGFAVLFFAGLGLGGGLLIWRWISSRTRDEISRTLVE